MLPLLIVAGATLIDERGGPVIGANERPDNAPIRAVGVVFLLSPILLAFGTLYYAVLRASLDRWFGGATLKALLAANTLLAAALSGFIVARELIDPIQVGLFALFSSAAQSAGSLPGGLTENASGARSRHNHAVI